MAKVRKVKSVNKAKNTTKKKKPRGVLAHKIHKTDIMDVQGIDKEKKKLAKLLNYYTAGISVKNALDRSRAEDFNRASTLRAVAPRRFSKGVYTIMVEASKQHIKHEFGVQGTGKALYHQVNIAWDLDSVDVDTLSVKEVFEQARVHFECACGRHTFWYRYIWTKIDASLGLQERRFPHIRNKNLEGMFCKHGLRALKVIAQSQFMKIFERYITAFKSGKRIRLTAKDKSSVTFQGYLMD